MTTSKTDIFISGGGIAGLAAALAFSSNGFGVVLADPSPPPADAKAEQADLRSTAFLQPARALLEQLDIWSALDSHATPLETLRVIHSAGDPPQIRTERAFQSNDLGEPAFGWNLPNWLTRRALTERASSNPGIDIRLGTGFKSLVTRDSTAMITLSDGDRVCASLGIAADGRASPLRQAVGIDTSITRYGQTALAFAVTHAKPHNNISTELYLSGGAFVLVPLPDHNGSPASAVVWMNDGSQAARSMGLGDDTFAQAATERSCNVLGPLSMASERRAWPVVTQRAKSLTARRIALVAEAAHVLPPIGAQGLNTSFTDIRHLVDLACKTPDQLGSTEMLDQYAQARARDIQTRARVIDFYNRLCRSNRPPLQALRGLGLKLVHDIAPLRQGVMRAGMGR